MNVLSCLRLTARCADILIYVCGEFSFAGNLEQELLGPVQKLEEYAFCVFYYSRLLTSHR